MEVNFFTIQPFTVKVSGREYTLSKSQQAIIVIAGIVGLAFLGIGAIFTFYGASYLLRRHLFRKINQDNQLSPSQNSHSSSISQFKEEVFERMQSSILSVIEELKPIHELKSIEYFIVFHSKNKVLQAYTKNISSQPSKDLQEMLILGIKESINYAKENGIQNELDARIKWSVIGQDNQDLLHGVVSHASLSFLQSKISSAESLNFYRNVEPSNRDRLVEMISKKMN